MIIMIPTLFLLPFCLLSVMSDDVKDMDLPKLMELMHSITEYRPNDVRKKDVRFFLFTKNESNTPMSLDGNTTIDVTKKTKIIIHGYIDNHNRSWYNRLTEAYLSHGDYNIIHVDWGRVAQSLYLSTAANTRLIGRIVAKFIIRYKFPPKNVHLIGHSLGAHISGYAAEIVGIRLDTKIRRVTALDPAGPGFRTMLLGQEKNLDHEDADVVDVFHTDGGGLGLYLPSGTFDVYINGGVGIQPDCILEVTKNISLKPGQVVEDSTPEVTKCESLVQYKTGQCNFHDSYVFGAEDIDETYTGVCFVNTVMGFGEIHDSSEH